MAYIENFASKLDWSMPFQRTGKFPLDRTSIFESYADALAYAKQDGSDKRVLGGTSYVGQIVAVYGLPESGTVEEVAAYIITAVGESASLMKLAQTTATGDFSKDIQALQTALSALEVRVKALEDKPSVVDTDTTYRFETAITTDGGIKYTVINKDGTEGSTGEVQVRGWQSLVNLATGRTSAFVYQNNNDPAFITDSKNKDKFKVGDIIYFTDTNVADQWVTGKLDSATSEGIWFTFADLETEHPDLSGYINATEIAQIYATKEALNAKANQSEVTALSATVTANDTANATAHQELQNAINKVADDLSKIDVSSQITAKINELDVTKVGGADKSYISSIEQVDGKIIATASTLPGVTLSEIDKPETISEGEIKVVSAVEKDATDDHTLNITYTKGTTKDYVDNVVQGSINTLTNSLTGEQGTVTKIASRVKVLEDAKYGEAIQTLTTQVSTNTSDISNLKDSVATNKAVSEKARDDVAALTITVGTNTSNITKNSGDIANLTNTIAADKAELNTAIAGRVKEIQLGGVKQTMDEHGVVNITQVSTDLLAQGNNVLVFDCLNAALLNQ